MRARNYIKEKRTILSVKLASLDFLKVKKHKKVFCLFIMIIAIVSVVSLLNKLDVNLLTTDNTAGFPQIMTLPVASASSTKGSITIPSGIVKANPFVPYGNMDSIQSAVPIYNLVEPPETLGEDSDAARVMDTIVSGILYDKFSPSAILNIEGTDYLVKKGDVVNNYKVLNITKDSVSVKLGTNTYKAGIGEILTEGTITQNNVSNLNKKFGGEKR